MAGTKNEFAIEQALRIEKAGKKLAVNAGQARPVLYRRRDWADELERFALHLDCPIVQLVDALLDGGRVRGSFREFYLTD